MSGRYDKVSGVWKPVKKRNIKVSGIWAPVKKRYDNVNGIWEPSYQGYDAQVHNLNSTVAGINTDGFLYVNAASSLSDRADVQIATITLSSPIPLTANQTCGTLNSIAATIAMFNGTSLSQIRVFLYDISFSQQLAWGFLENPYGVNVSGNISIDSIDVTGSYQQFGIAIAFIGTPSTYIQSYYASAPAGCLTLGEIQLKEIELI